MITPNRQKVNKQEAVDMLALSRDSQDRMSRIRERDESVLLLVWGVVWLVVFGLLWRSAATSMLNDTAITLATSGVMVVGVLATIFIHRHENKEIRGLLRRAHMRVFWSWSGAMVSIAILTTALHASDVDSEVIASILQPLLASSIIGLTLLQSGLSTRHMPSAVVGGWLIMLSIGVVWLPVPLNLGVLALGGGGGMIAVALCWLVRHKQSRSAS